VQTFGLLYLCQEHWFILAYRLSLTVNLTNL